MPNQSALTIIGVAHKFEAYMETIKLNKVVKRRHPEYAEMLEHWNFLEATYKGGRSWFKDNIFKYMKEGDSEFNDRVERAYRFNHTREIVDLVNKYVFRGAEGIQRSDDAPKHIKDFWKNSTRSGQSIEEFIPILAKKSSTFGRIWVVVDSSASSAALTVEDAKKMNEQVYAYYVRPQDMLDCGYDEFGQLVWIVIRELNRDDDDPFESDGKVSYRYRLWTREAWFLLKDTGTESAPKVEIEDGDTHDLGVVPVFPLDNMIQDGLYTTPSLINDIAYLDRACANYLSNLDAIIQDQTFSQLAMPGQGLLSGENAYDKLLEMGTKRIFLYDGEGGGAPHFISPDPKQAELIITSIKQIINEIYHSVGVAGERTKQDNAAGIDNSSGVAKAFDFERVNSLLISKGASLNSAENKLVELVNLWHSASKGEDLVKYPESYDVRGLFDEIAISERLEAITAPLRVKQHQLKRVLEKMYPQLDAKTKAELESAIDEVKDDFDDMVNNVRQGRPSLPGQAKGESEKDDGQSSD